MHPGGWKRESDPLAKNRIKGWRFRAFIVADTTKVSVFVAEGRMKPRLSTFDCGFFDFILSVPSSFSEACRGLEGHCVGLEKKFKGRIF